MRGRVVISMLVVLALAPACGGSNAPSKPLLFAALEARGTTDPTQWNTVVIAALDGRARAESSFAPMPVPYVGCAGPVMPASAHVAAGKVFFADGSGKIRSLAPDGHVADVTSFPLASSQRMLSFAVSPDGGRLLGTIFTLPPRPGQPSDVCTSEATPFGSQSFTLDVYAAPAGGPSHLLYHQDLGAFGDSRLLQLLSFIGWDAIGPLATYPTGWATQGGGPVHWPGMAVRVDPSTGRVVKPVEPSNWVWDIASTGDYVCIAESGDISIRRPNRSEIWRVPADPTGTLGYEYVLLSTDERHVAIISHRVFARDGTSTQLPDDFFYAGWLDSSTLISGDLNKDLSYLRLADPSKVTDLGFKGMYIGTLQT